MALDGIFGGDEEPMQETKPPPGNRADLIEWRLAQVENFLGWDKNEPNRAHVEWTAVRHRSCDGMMYRWAFSGTDMVELESTAVQDFSFPEDEIGKPVKWYSTFLVPTWFKDNAKNPTYRLRMEFYCNPLQRHSPLIVAPPEVPLTVTERAKDAVEPPRVQSQRNTP